MQCDTRKIGRKVSACCIVLALAALHLQACTDQRMQGIARRKMYAIVVQCTENELLVEPEEESSERRSSDRIYVPAAEAKLLDENKNTILFEEFREGDRVKVAYDGVILETYPGRVGNCYGIHWVGKTETSSATE